MMHARDVCSVDASRRRAARQDVDRAGASLTRSSRGFKPGGAESGLEVLEIRCVPASSKAHALLAPAARAVNVGGELVITGSGTFTVSAQLNAVKAKSGALTASRNAALLANSALARATGVVKISAPGYKTVVVRVRSLSSIRINGSAGDDAITVNGKAPDRFLIIIDPKGGANQISSSIKATIVGVPETGQGSGFQNPGVVVDLSPMAQDVVNRVNQIRVAAGLNALSVQAQLTQAAASSANLMAAFNRMAHEFPESPSLQTLTQRASAAGYRYLSLGENVAAGYQSAEDVVAGWMSSDAGHRETILMTPARDIGVAISQSASGTLYFCLVVGNPYKS